MSFSTIAGYFQDGLNYLSNLVSPTTDETTEAQ